MKQKKILAFLFAASLSVSMFTACGSQASSDAGSASSTSVSASSESTASESASSASETAESTSASSESTAEDKEAEAKQLMSDLTGSYQELWPVILADEYHQTWIDDCAEFVGDDNAEAAYEKLFSMVTGTVYGEDAVAAYADGGGVYDCEFTEGVNTLEFDGTNSTIKGYDESGEEIFSHSYHYVGMEEIRGLYEFESDDADSGEFTYFCIAPDTNTTTYHIELRYGSDLEALGKYDAGKYAYWLGSGISTDCDQTMIENCIHLFCEENLSEQAE